LPRRGFAGFLLWVALFKVPVVVVIVDEETADCWIIVGIHSLGRSAFGWLSSFARGWHRGPSMAVEGSGRGRCEAWGEIR
jgi:hypothetical protein